MIKKGEQMERGYYLLNKMAVEIIIIFSSSTPLAFIQAFYKINTPLLGATAGERDSTSLKNNYFSLPLFFFGIHIFHRLGKIARISEYCVLLCI